MNILADPNEGPESAAPLPRRPAQLVILAVVLFAESALLAAASIFLLTELFVDEPLSYASAIALLALSLLATVWLAVLAVQTLRGTPWTRGAATVWQVLQIAVGVGAMQGEYARTDVGWALLVPAIIALMMLFSRPVVHATARREEFPES